MTVKSCFNWLQWLQSVSATKLRVLVMRLNTLLPTVIDPSYVAVAMSLTVTSSLPPSSQTSRKNIIDTVARDRSLHVRPAYRYNIVLSQSYAEMYRRTSQGCWGGCSPPDSGKTIIFQAKAKFFGQQPKLEKNTYFVFIKRKKLNSFCLARKVPEIWDFY